MCCASRGICHFFSAYHPHQICPNLQILSERDFNTLSRELTNDARAPPSPAPSRIGIDHARLPDAAAAAAGFIRR